jgi:MoxR-like ATPase
MFKLLVTYPTTPEEQNILQHYADGRDIRDLSRFDLATVLTGREVLNVIEACTTVIVEPSIINYITAIVARTRNWHSVAVGASPRAGVNILLAARAMAACHGRNFVVPDDVKELSPWVLRHRLRLRPEAEIEGIAPDDTIREILDAVEAPRK